MLRVEHVPQPHEQRELGGKPHPALPTSAKPRLGLARREWRRARWRMPRAFSARTARAGTCAGPSRRTSAPIRTPPRRAVVNSSVNGTAAGDASQRLSGVHASHDVPAARNRRSWNSTNRLRFPIPERIRTRWEDERAGAVHAESDNKPGHRRCAASVHAQNEQGPSHASPPSLMPPNPLCRAHFGTILSAAYPVETSACEATRIARTRAQSPGADECVT